MQQDFTKMSYRKQIIEEIKGDENNQRKISSFKKQNMQNDNFYQYVKEHLESKLDSETVLELEIFSDINLQKRVSKSEATIYSRQPKRKFHIGEEETEDLKEIYASMDIDTVLKRANVSYKYQDQCSVQVFPDQKELRPRVLLPHHYDVVPMEADPEKPFAYIISNFDNTSRDRIRKRNEATGFSQGDKYRDQTNQEIGDFDDAHLEIERFWFWTHTMNFVTNGKGEVLDKETFEVLANQDTLESTDENMISPLYEQHCLPFIDIATEKDFEFWVRSGDVLFDATVRYNVILTSEFQTVEMQGHAQPYYKGDAEHMPENVRIGVDKMIFIPVNPNNPVAAEFGFANPGSDLNGIRDFRESFLSAFLSARGLDASIISGDSNVQTASSGIEKMLQMVEKFEASQEDFSLFKNVEKQMLEIISCWVIALKGARNNGELILNDTYQKIAINESSDITVQIEYTKPEMTKTELEILEVVNLEIEMGVSSKVHYLMEQKGMTEKQAIEFVAKVDEYEGMTEPKTDGESDDFTKNNF